MNDISKFKFRLKELRKNHNMTQEELSSKLGIVRTAIANYETGRTNPDPETLSLIANIFNTSTDYLLGRTDFNQPIVQGYKPDIVRELEYEYKYEKNIYNEINDLSPESQEDLKKYIELLRIKDKQKRNSEVSDELTNLE